MKPRMEFGPTDDPPPDQQARWEVVKTTTPPVAYTIPYTELEEASPNDRLAPAWNTYVRIVGRLLAEGHEGKWVHLRGDKLIGVYDSQFAAYTDYDKQYSGQTLIKQVLAREPVYDIRLSLRWTIGPLKMEGDA